MTRSHQRTQPQPHSWMILAALWANWLVHMHKLSNFDRSKLKHNLNGFLCIHFDPVMLKTWQKLGFLNERDWKNNWPDYSCHSYLDFELDESLAHSSLNFVLELAMQLQKYICLWILQEVQWMKCMSNLTDRFVPGINIYTNYHVLLAVNRSMDTLVWLALTFRT